GPKYARESAQQGVALIESFAPAITNDTQRMVQMRTAYVVQARILGFMGLAAEAMDPTDKLVALTEAYWRGHPQDEKALVSLSIAYNAAALIADPRLPQAAASRKSVALLGKSLWADEQLLALKPNEPDYLQRQAQA